MKSSPIYSSHYLEFFYCRFCFYLGLSVMVLAILFYSCIQWPTIQFCLRKPARSCNGRYPKHTIFIARHRPANRRTALSRSTISSDDIRFFAYDFCLLLLQYKTLVSFATSYKFSVSTDKTKYCVKFFF